MARISKIEWTDATFNPWIGCTKVSSACDHCYAEISTPARTLGVEWGAGHVRRRTSAANWKLPLKWNRAEFNECGDCGGRGEIDTLVSDVCHQCGKHEKLNLTRRRVFCASLADWLDNEVQAEWLADLLNLIRLTPNLDWLLLTKRVGNWEARLTVAHQHVVKTIGGGTAEHHHHPLWPLGIWIQDWLTGKAPVNVWIGATICKQAEADRDIPKLLRVPAAVRYLSIEPMLGPINLTDITTPFPSGSDHFSALYDPDDDSADTQPYLNWVIAGGESGSNARPVHPQWFRNLRDQCTDARVAFFMKQWGEWLPISEIHDHEDLYWPAPENHPEATRHCKVKNGILHVDGTLHGVMEPGAFAAGSGAMHVFRAGKKAAGRLLDTRMHNEYPARP